MIQRMSAKPQNQLKTLDIVCKEEIMPKDSQPDNKEARMKKCNGQTPITEENHQKNKNAKRKSIPRNDV